MVDFLSVIKFDRHTYDMPITCQLSLCLLTFIFLIMAIIDFIPLSHIHFEPGKKIEQTNQLHIILF